VQDSVTGDTEAGRGTSDTMVVMRLALAALIVAAGCDDPSLRIEVIPVDGFAVTATTVAVYQSDSLGCLDVELGKASAETLGAAFVADAVVEAGDELVGVSRTEPKLFVAEAVDANGRRLYAGCAARAEITDDDVVTIQAHAIATITVSGDALDKPFARRSIAVAAVDANGRPIDQRHVEWASFGVAGSFPPDGVRESDPTVCTRSGLARLEPADPDTPGPIAAQIRVSWAESTPPPLSGFIEAVSNQVDLRDGSMERTSPACVVRRSSAGSADRVYCLTRPATALGPRQVVELDLVGNTLAVTSVGAPVAANHLVATNADGGGDDDLYILERVGNRVRWTGIAGTATGGNFDPCTYFLGAGVCGLVSVRSVVVVPSCAASPGFAVLSFSRGVTEPDIVVFTDLHGNPIASQPTLEMSAQLDLRVAGRVAEATAEATQHQAVAARVTPLGSGESPYNLLIALCGGEPCFAEWPGFGAVGFSGGDVPRLISSEVDITGNVVVESEIVVVGGGNVLLVERARTPTPAPARAIATADVDLDDTEDLAWSQFLIDDVGDPQNRIQVAVGRTGLPFPGRLTGLSPNLPGALAQVLFARLDDDATPDLVTYSDQEAAVYRAGVQVPHGNPPGAETTCP
jgi:hypothetical protein